MLQGLFNCELSNSCVTLFGSTFSWWWLAIAIGTVLLGVSLWLIFRTQHTDQQTIQITDPADLHEETTNEDKSSGGEDEEILPRIDEIRDFPYKGPFPTQMQALSLDDEEGIVNVLVIVHLPAGYKWIGTSGSFSENMAMLSAGFTVTYIDADGAGVLSTWDLNPDNDYLWFKEEEYDDNWSIRIETVKVVIDKAPIQAQ